MEKKRHLYSGNSSRRKLKTLGGLEAKFRKPPIRKSPITTLAKKDPESKSVTQQRTVKKATLQQSFLIQRYLNFTELLPGLIHPDLRFLSMEELDRIHRLPTDAQKANELLLVLGKRSSLAASKFLASLWLTREHLGHEELFSNIFPLVAEDKAQRIVQLCRSRSSSSPVRPPAFIHR